MENKKRFELGDAPIQPEYRAKMEGIARVLDNQFNGIERPRKVGFVLLVFPFGGDPNGRCNYISNGADRRDVMRLLYEQAKRFQDQGVE